MVECSECSSILKNNAGLRSHKSRYHPAISSNKLNTIALVNLSRKRSLSNGPDIRKRDLNKMVHSTSGESSDSDSTMDSSGDDAQTEKPRWVKLPEKPQPCKRENLLISTRSTWYRYPIPLV